jgi:hypothetical protein
VRGRGCTVSIKHVNRKKSQVLPRMLKRVYRVVQILQAWYGAGGARGRNEASLSDLLKLHDPQSIPEVELV